MSRLTSAATRFGLFSQALSTAFHKYTHVFVLAKGQRFAYGGAALISAMLCHKKANSASLEVIAKLEIARNFLNNFRPRRSERA
jgi:hypothetical protein